jgi:NAD(P)-dependent dehydrogenase (short-subunit alcohol dehydrogenase family)
VARIAITGSTTGIGFDAAARFVELGHEVVVHARNAERAATLPAEWPVVIGDLEDHAQVCSVAAQFDALGPFDAVIHNAGIDETPTRLTNAAGECTITAVNVYAPYVLTALMARPPRLIYIGSSSHYPGIANLDDVHWERRSWDGTQAYCDSKLFVTTFALALANRWTDTVVHVVDPGWVPTRMGGPSATDDLVLGHRTQVWLATANHDQALDSGGYWFHRDRLTPHEASTDQQFQRAVLDHLRTATSVDLP